MNLYVVDQDFRAPGTEIFKQPATETGGGSSEGN
jgi:hypothetical protein